MAEIYLRTMIGDVVLDAELREVHSSDLRITDNPVESGAAVGDHAVLEPKTVQIEGVIVDYEPSADSPFPLDGFALRGPEDFLNLLPMAMDFKAVTTQASAYAARTLASYTQKYTTQADQVFRAIAPWLLGGNDQSGSSSSRLNSIYESLLALQIKGETIDVQTGLRLYKSMLLPSVAGYMDRRGAMQVSITAQELFVVETKKISGVQVPSAGASKSGRAGAQSAAKSSKGNTSPKDAPAEKNRSAIKEVFG
ncbi:MAG: hypothetical protein KA735_04865 [Burkholderiaceae bacterium]|nr:hypothetical protein [Burkholderiaceae bacterium]